MPPLPEDTATAVEAQQLTIVILTADAATGVDLLVRQLRLIAPLFATAVDSGQNSVLVTSG